MLRQDNADLRLTPKGEAIGLVSEKRAQIFAQKKSLVESLKKFIRDTSVTPEEIQDYLISVGSAPLTQGRKIAFLLSRGEVTLRSMSEALPCLADFIRENHITEEILEEVEIQVKYRGYIEREKLVAEKLHRLENIRIPSEFDFHAIQSLTMEARQKLSRIRPATIGQASRIPGVSPADINVLLIYFGR